MERKEDIPVLIGHFLTKFAHKFSKKISGMDPRCLEVLLSYSFPGNVRELENIMERAVALTEGETVHVKDLPPDLREYSVTPYGKWLTCEEHEKEYLMRVLEFTDYNLGQATKILDLPRTTLWRKMKKYGLGRSLR